MTGTIIESNPPAVTSCQPWFCCPRRPATAMVIGWFSVGPMITVRPYRSSAVAVEARSIRRRHQFPLGITMVCVLPVPGKG